MQQTSAKRNWRTRLSLFVVLAYLIGLLSPAVAPAKPAVAQPLAPQADVVLATYGFEDGTTQGWYGRGAAVVASVTTVAHEGARSLGVTGRNAGWNGPALNLLDLLIVGGTYRISGCIRLAAGTASTRTNFAVEYKPVGGSTSWHWLGVENNTTDTAWACVSGSFEYTAEAETLTLYAESASATADFFIDDVAIVMTTPPTIATYGFEDNTPQGWYARGGTGIAVDVVTDPVHTGNYALRVTGRTGGWNGPALDVLNLLKVGATYQISGCIRLAEGLGPFRTNFALQYTIGGSSTYPWVGSDNNTTSTAWSCMTGSFKYTTQADALTLYAECSDASASFYIDDVTIIMTEPPTTAPPPPIQDFPSVYDFYKDDFLVGAAIEPAQLASERHVELFLKHFNSLTAENAMKPGPIQPTEGTFDWSGADTLAAFARANNVAIHGHTLVWHQQTADWMFQNDAGEWLTPTVENKQLVLDRLEDHIVAVVNRYKDVVNVWDVVNEVIDPAQPDCLRRSRWYELTGSDYISTAFTIAHREAPTATLILNDYGETDPAKRQCMYNVVKGLKDQGVPIDGIGMQMHINIQNPSAAAIEETIEMFAELGEVHITELDMSIYTNDTDSYTTVPPEVLIKQGYRYKEIFEVFRRHADKIGSVTFWGMADDHTWLSTWPINRINLPLLFDKDLQAKWAYWGIIDPSRLPPLIKEQLVSQATPVVDGKTEVLWEMLPWIDIGSTGAMTASFQTRWDAENNLYVIVKVEDPTVDAGDKVEVFVDQNNHKTATYEGDDRYYAFPSGTFQMDYVIITNTHGYVLEARLPLTATLAPGARLGFDVRVTDGSDNSVISWNDLTHSQLTSTANFGTLILIGEYKLTQAIKGTPVIDGRADAIWADANEINTDVWVMGTGGATAKVRTMWDEGHLYVYAIVSDTLLSKASANPWEEDSVEVFVDQNNAKTTSYESDDGQYRVNFDNDQSFNPAALTGTLRSETFIIPEDQTLLMEGSYIVEAAITLTAVMPQPGVLIGFDFQVNDDADGDGDRDSVAIWNDPTGQSWQNTSRIGVLQFVERPLRMLYLPLVMRAYAP